MPNNNRLYSNLQQGTISASLNTTATTVTSNGFATIPVVDTTSHFVINMGAEIMWVTAHAAGATSCTVLRGQEGTTAVNHQNAAPWIHTLVASDLTRHLTTKLTASQVLPLQFGNYLVDATAGAVVITLTSPISDTDVSIKKIDASANTVTIAPASGTIDGAATQVLSAQYSKLRITSDGTNYWLA